MKLGIAETIAKTLVPEPFREFLPMVSPSGLRVIHKDQVLARALEAVGHYFSSTALAPEVATLQTVLDSAGFTDRISLIDSIPIPFTQQDLGPTLEKRVGELILALYFLIVKSDVAFFLDLRPERFHWDPKTDRLLWSPPRLWYRRSPDFANRLRSLYRGFFERDPTATAEGIALYRWESEPKAGFDERIDSLLRQHFGDAERGPVLFSKDHFKRTFHLIFEEAISSRSRFHPELTFVGTALAGMYQSLDGIGQPLDVKAVYQSVFR